MPFNDRDGFANKTFGFCPARLMARACSVFGSDRIVYSPLGRGSSDHDKVERNIRLHIDGLSISRDAVASSMPRPSSANSCFFINPPLPTVEAQDGLAEFAVLGFATA